MRKLSIFAAFLCAVLTIGMIPANGVAASSHLSKHQQCKRHHHGKKHRCGKHRISRHPRRQKCVEYELPMEPNGVRIVECNGRVVVREPIGPQCESWGPNSNCPCSIDMDNCLPPNPDPACAFMQNGCKEEAEGPTLEATEMKVSLFVDETVTPATESTWGCAKLNFPHKDKITIRFLAYYGSFQSAVWGGAKGPAAAPVDCSEYIPPPHPEYVVCSSDDPRVIDTAWVVVLDSTTNTFIESERVKFNIENPEENVENVRCPVG